MNEVYIFWQMKKSHSTSALHTVLCRCYIAIKAKPLIVFLLLSKVSGDGELTHGADNASESRALICITFQNSLISMFFKVVFQRN